MKMTEIPKEQLGEVYFGTRDVLSNTSDKERRIYSLQKALLLGNLYHHKVNISFYDKEGRKYWVNTTIWSVDDSLISLKGGRNIPITAIEDIEF